MSIDQDTEFLASLRGMVDDVAPRIAPLSAAAVIPAARRRIAHRRSLISGAFGLVLLAGAGATQVLPAVVHNSPAQVAVMSADMPAPAPGELGRYLPPAGITPLDGDIDAAADAPEATSSSFDAANPWTVPLIAAGATALGTGAVIAARAPKTVKSRTR